MEAELAKRQAMKLLAQVQQLLEKIPADFKNVDESLATAKLLLKRTCSQCGEILKSKKTFIHHMKQSHGDLLKLISSSQEHCDEDPVPPQIAPGNPKIRVMFSAYDYSDFKQPLAKRPKTEWKIRFWFKFTSGLIAVNVM